MNFKNLPVRTGDIKGGPKQPPLATNRGSQEPATNRVKPFSVESRKTSREGPIRPPPPPVIGLTSVMETGLMTWSVESVRCYAPEKHTLTGKVFICEMMVDAMVIIIR